MKKLVFLVVGMFTLGFDAYVIAGLVPNISAELEVSASQAGQGVTLFTVCYALSAPIFSTALAHMPIRRTLTIGLVVFSLGNLGTAVATGYSLFLVARGVAGLGAGLFSPLAISGASAIVPSEKRGRALGFTLAGMSSGTVLGVPAGLLIAEQVGWRSTMGLITLLGIVGTVGVLARFPALESPELPSLRARVAMLARPAILRTVSVTFLAAVASLGLYTYLAPVLHDTANTAAVTPYLWFWGIGGLIGAFGVGSLIDRTRAPAVLMACLLGLLAVAVVLVPSTAGILGLGLVPFLAWGLAGWASQTPQQHVLLEEAGSNGSAAVALNSSFNYLGSGIGSALGGGVLAAGADANLLPYLAGVVALLALLVQLGILWLRAHYATEQEPVSTL